MQALAKGLADGSIKTNVPPVKPAAATAAPAKTGPNMTLIIIIVLVVLILVAAAFFLFRPKKK
jgi:hypothetical protein